MKKLSTTWRHQKTLSVTSSLATQQNEKVQQNLGKKRLGRLAVASASVAVKAPVEETSETVTASLCNNEDIPSSFLSSFSASVNKDLLQELEKVEAVLGTGIYKSQTKPESISASEYGTQKKKGKTGNIVVSLKPTSSNASSKLVVKRKYIKEAAVHSSEVDVNLNCSSHLVVHRLPSKPTVSPTSSPADKRPKHTLTATKGHSLSKCKTLYGNLSCKSSNSHASRNSQNIGASSDAAPTGYTKMDLSASKDSDSGSDSFNFSDTSFSPICSNPGGDVDVFDISKDESPKIKQSLCRDFLRTDNQYIQTNVTSQQRQLVDHHYKTVTNAVLGQPDVEVMNCKSTTKFELITKTVAVEPSNSGQRRSHQIQTTIPDHVTMKKSRRAHSKGHLEEATVLAPLKKITNKGSGNFKGSNHHLPLVLDSVGGCKNNQENRNILQIYSDSLKGNLKAGTHGNYTKPNSESLDGTVFGSNAPVINKRYIKEKNNLSSTSGNVNSLQEDSFGSASLTVDKRQLSSWGLPEPVLEAYKSQGVLTMFEWQSECLLTGNVLDGGNLVYSAPTSAGKTLVAELLMLKRVLESRKKALFILPFVSVAREKMYSLQRLYQDAGIRVGGYMGSYSPPGGFSHVHIAVCTIEKGNGLINRLMEEGKLGELGAVVIDELHMVGDSHRGYLLELMLTKLAYIIQRTKDCSSNCQIQIIGMSATLPNLPLLAKWLDASLYCTDFRPVPLTEYIKVNNRLVDGQLVVQREIPALLTSPDDADHVVALSIETVSNGHGVLVFCPTKNWCEKLCETIARRFYTLTRHNQDRTAEEKGDDASGSTSVSLSIKLDRNGLTDTVEQLKRSPSGLDPMLGRCVLNGVAYHHAGLTFDERDIIEGAFRQGHLKVVVATSTLSSGVNLPARRVIIRTPMFFGKVIDTLTYKQMVGRAGRKGIDTEGESVLICKPQETKIGSKLVKSELPPVESCLHFNAEHGLTGSLKRAILEVVVSGVAATPEDVISYVNCTLLSASLSEDTQDNVKSALVESCITFLQENEFVTVNITHNEDGTNNRKFYPTQLGSAILASSLSPDEGLLVFAELQKARRAFVLDTDLHIIYLVTPVYTSDVSASIDWYHYHHLWETLTPADRRVADLVGVSESFIARAIQGRVNGKTETHRKLLAIHQRFYTALVLNCLIQECALMEVAAKFNSNKGQLQSLQQSASTYAGMITVFCGRLGWYNLELILSQFHKRLSFGVQQELVDLVRISALNASSARMLYNAGYHTVADVARAESSDIENLFKNAMPFQSEKKQDGETDWELKERRRARCIWLTGRKGVTELDAALTIIEEAMVIVKDDLGVTGITWGAKDKVEETNAADSSEEESTVNEAHSELFESTEVGDQSNVERPHKNGSSQICNSKIKVNTTLVADESVNTDHMVTAEARHENKLNQVVKNSSHQKSFDTDISQRKSLSNTGRRSSSESLGKKENSIFHMKHAERSFFGHMVVSPPEGVRNRVNDVNSTSSKGNTCLKVTSMEISEIDCKAVSDETVLHKVNNVEDVTMQNQMTQNELVVLNVNPLTSSGPAPAVSAAATISASILDDVTINCVSNCIQICSVSRTALQFQTSAEQCEVTGESIAEENISFGESFEINTQISNIINYNGQGIEKNHNGQNVDQNQQAMIRRLNCNTASASKCKFSVTDSEMKSCKIPTNPISVFSNVNSIQSNYDVLNQGINGVCRSVSSGTVINSVSEDWLLDCENDEQITPRKSETNINSENVHESFSESLFDCTEKHSESLFDSTEKQSQQKPVVCDESTPKRTVVKSVKFLKSCLENLVVDNGIHSRAANQNCEIVVSLSESRLPQNLPPINMNCEENYDEEEICSSLIEASNFERLMHLDEGMLQDKSLHGLNYSCDDLHVFEVETDIKTDKTGCKDKNLLDENVSHRSQPSKTDKKSVPENITKGGNIQVKLNDCTGDTYYEETFSETLDMSDSFSCPSLDSSPKPSASVPRNAVNIPRNSTPSVTELNQKIKNVSKSQTNAIYLCKGRDVQLANENMGSDEFFSDSFSSSLMDKVMAECDVVSKIKSVEQTAYLPNMNCCKSAFGSSTGGADFKAGIEKKNMKQNVCDAPSPASINTTEPLSNNSSRNDGSDCVPPTPPDETSSAATPFKLSFYSPLKPNVSKTSNVMVTPKREVPKNLCSKQGMDDFTIIKDRKTEDAVSKYHINVNKQTISLHYLEDSMANHLSQSTHCSPLINVQTQSKDHQRMIFSKINSTLPTDQTKSFTCLANEHNQCLSASQLLTQQSFTIIDVCADKQLFETFLAELKSKPYYALSVACEKKPLDRKHRAASEIGGRFLRKKTSPKVARSKMAVGIPVPDTDAFIVGLAFSWENRDSYFVSLMPTGVTEPFESDLEDTLAEPPLDETLTQEQRITSLAAVFEPYPGNGEQTVAAYDSKAVYVCLAKALGFCLPRCEDPCVADWLREPDARLKNLHQMVLNHCPEEINLLDAIGGGHGYQSIGTDIKSKVDGRLRACSECVLTQKLINKYRTLLTDENLLTAFTDVEMPSIVTLARMELNGFGISESEIEKQKTLLTVKLNMLEEQAYKMAGHVFSLTSPTDIATVLYLELKLPLNGDPKLVHHLPTRGQRGKRLPIGSTSKEILEKLQKFNLLPAVILEWRRLNSALTKSLFTLKHAARHCPKLDMFRVYGDCQIFTSTGRISMAEPNVQNVPKDFVVEFSASEKDHRGEEKNTKNVYIKHSSTTPVSMRKMFIPFRGGVILAADYSQLELRIIAHLSGDSKLASILNTTDGDVFKIIAAQMNGLDIAEVSVEQRQQAKQVCYGMLYGIGPRSLAEQLGVDENDADAFIETFKSKYPGIRKYLQKTIEFCQKNSYVKTLFNRRRYLPSIKHTNPHARAQAERQAVNTTIQGSAADLVKIAMNNIDRKLMDLFPDTRRCHSQFTSSKEVSDRKKSKIPQVFGAFFVLQLHDELIYEVSVDQVQVVARLVKHCMETAVKLSICMPVKIKIGPSWGELTDYDILG